MRKPTLRGSAETPVVTAGQPRMAAPGRTGRTTMPTTSGRRLRVLLITNLAPPYRQVVWEEFGTLCDLTVLRLARTEPNRRWDAEPEPAHYRTRLVRAFPLGPVGLLRHLYVLRCSAHALLRYERPDVVMLGSWESPAYQTLLAAARRRGTRTVLWCESHGGSNRFRRGPVAALRRRTFLVVDAVLAAGGAAHAAARDLGVPDDRNVLARQAIDLDGIRRATGAHRADAHPGPGESPVDAGGDGDRYDDHAGRERPSAPHHYLFVGQLIERKNPAAMVRAFAGVAMAHDRLTVVGDGPLAAELRDLAARVAPGRVVFRGHLADDDLWEAFARAHTLVAPSLSEVYGLVVLEGLAAGLNVVVSRRAGVVEDVAGLPGVHLCDPDVDGVAEAMRASRTGNQSGRRPGSGRESDGGTDPPSTGTAPGPAVSLEEFTSRRLAERMAYACAVACRTPRT